MALKISIKYILCLTINVLLLLTGKIYACGWSEDEETIRLALFRAQLSNGSAFNPFLYSFNNFNSDLPDPERIDQFKNCAEWQKRIGMHVALNDIDLVIYQSDPELFQLAYNNNNLNEIFEGNTFIKALLLKKNKDLLQYLVFAKEMEYFSFSLFGRGKWEDWDDISYSSHAFYNNDFSSTESSLPNIRDSFLRQRYAFLLLRYSYYTGENEKCMKMYDTYFSDTTATIIEPWALLFKALATDDLGKHIEANYLFSQVFNRSDEKKLAAFRNFNRKPEAVNQTLLLARSDKEKSVILTMSIANYPGPALDKIKVIHKLGADDRYISFLVTREINKLEDWMFTPKFTNYTSAVQRSPKENQIWFYNYNNKWADYAVIKENNYKKDLIYLQQLRNFLLSIYPGTSGEMKSYLSMSIAHLYYMDNDLVSGKKYINSIRETANVSIINQKYIELALVELHANTLQQNPNNTILVNSLRQLEKISVTNFEYYKHLYSLTRIISGTYKIAGNNAIAALFYTKSDTYKEKYEIRNFDYYYDNYYHNMYSHIGYLDRIANMNDIDQILNILETKNKTELEKYLCEQPVGNRNVYLDLKATIAFRNNDLQKASEILAEIPQIFYDTAYEYKDYLNEDPFVPKAWRFQVKRDFTYPFKKAEFINTLIQLEKNAQSDPQKAAENYILLGHAYYNCSFNGNSWMMVSYENDEIYYNRNDYLYGPQYQLSKKIQGGNYFQCTLAKQYYTKALKTAINDEQRAMASLMIHICDYDAYQFSNLLVEYDKIPPYVPGISLRNFYKKYKDTEVYKTFHCPLLEDFIARK